jgi:hypothetical protein
MSRTGALFLLVVVAGCSTTGERRIDPTAPHALGVHATAATAEGCMLDASECPPDAWVFSPSELEPNIPHDASNCDFTMFGLTPTIPQWDFHPTAACRERQWGQSGIYRQQARDIHVTNLPNRCGGPGDIDEIRICALAWKNKPTPYGMAGGAGCIVVQLAVRCGV